MGYRIFIRITVLSLFLINLIEIKLSLRDLLKEKFGYFFPSF